MAVLANTPYEVTAETLHPCQVGFVRCDDFLKLLAKHPEMHEGVLKQLTTLYSGAVNGSAPWVFPPPRLKGWHDFCLIGVWSKISNALKRLGFRSRKFLATF